MMYENSMNISQDPQPNTQMIPVDPLPTAKQEARFIDNNKILKNEHQFTYQNIHAWSRESGYQTA